MYWFTAALAILLFAVLINKKVCAAAGLSSKGLDFELKIYPFYYALGFTIRGVVRRVPGEGFYVSVNGGRPKKIKRKKRMRLNFFRFTDFKELSASGTIGFEGRPDRSVLVSGALGILLTQIFVLLTRKRSEAHIAPDLERSSFALNVEGIISVSPGRLIKEIIKSKGKEKE